MKIAYITIAALILICANVYAAVNWSADFETPPYVLGPIAAQQGWWATNNNSTVVADGTTPSGLQVLQIAGPGEAGGGNAICYPNASTDLVKVTWYMNGPTGASGHAAAHFRSGSTYFVMNEFQETGDAGWGVYNLAGGTGNQYAGDGGAKITWTAGTWVKLEFWLDLANDQFAVEIDDVLIDEWYNNAGALIGTHTWTPFMANVSNFNTWQIRISEMNAVGTPYKVDGLVVEEIDLNPEITDKQAGIMLQWTSVPGVVYSIYSTDDPSAGWELVDQVSAEGTETQWIDTGDTVRANPASGSVTKRYYRIEDE